jgi:hypothetical protein
MHGDQGRAYQEPLPVPCMSRCCLSTRLRKCSLRVLRLAPVERIISPTVTRPCCRMGRGSERPGPATPRPQVFRARPWPKAAAYAGGAGAEKTAPMAANSGSPLRIVPCVWRQGEGISLLGLLDHAFKRAVEDIGKSRLEEKQIRENAAETSVAVLKG